MSVTETLPEIEADAGPIEVVRRPLSTDEYLRMAEDGYFRGERLELIEGEILRMSPTGSRHYWIVKFLMGELARGLDEPERISVQATLPLGGRTTVDPDLFLVRKGEHGHRDPLTGPADVLLVVEVSDSSLRYDRKVKARLYAKAGIPEYWVVDVERQVVIVHLGPGRRGYASVTEHPADARVPLVAAAEAGETLVVDFTRVFR